MNGPSIIPVTNEQAKAIQEALKTLRGIGGFLEEMFGTVPADVVGLLGGDWLKVRRAENLQKIIEKARKRLDDKEIKPEPASLSVGLPILEAAADESREELQDIWAALSAAAANPERSRLIRNVFVEIIKKMDPLDAAVLKSKDVGSGARIDGNARNNISQQLGLPRGPIDVSIQNLEKLGLFHSEVMYTNVTSLGREFMRTLDI